MPRTSTGTKTYGLTQMEAECGGGVVDMACSSLVVMPDPSRKGAISQRFLKALRTLDLKPFVHGSQLVDTIEAETTIVRTESIEGQEDVTKGAGSKQKGAVFCLCTNKL